MDGSYGSLYIYGLQLLNTHSSYASYGPNDVARKDYQPQQTFFCQRCNVNFATQALLARHLWDKHPTKSPVFLLGDRELTSTRLTVRSKTSLEQVKVLNADSITVNDTELSVEQLNTLISSATNQFFNIVIANDGVTKRFELDVKLVANEDIQDVDQCFFDCFGKAQLTNEGIQTFIKLTSKYTAADEYVDGLVSYLVGLQAKAGRASVISFEAHLDKLSHAYGVLAEFNSPLAIAICDIISFMTNSLSEVFPASPLKEVYSAVQYLLTGQLNEVNHSQAVNFAQLPIDNATHHLVEIVNHELHQYKRVEELESKLKALSGKTEFTTADKNKINLLLFWKSLELGDRASQEKYARKLRHWDEIEQVITQYD